ncbi:C40 family peptidase [Campylobacter hyointestinalis]|uniref:C40 family peptidase n=1 Tax=Campylobacter hyointestinalis TaxID=198 RepID=UPI0007265A83|nr:C40 family peptidase [Campylobacter hyointestinalis]CUU82766.1 Probable endopeptidase p60 precursor [Campylobacter hyointestinalis subsp. hyointestinalis]
MQEFKARAKMTQKMTRDGVVETNEATGEQTRTSQRETDDFSGDTAENVTGKALNRAAAERQRHKAKKRRKKADKATQKAQEATGKQTARLQFSEAERSDPELAKYVKKSEKAADRLEAAREKIPKQKRIKAAREFDEATGRAKTRLYFEKTDKPPNGKLHHNPADRPVREIKNYVHGKVSEVEKDNSGVEGAHKSEKVAERAGGYAARKLKEGYRSHKLKPYREAAKAEAASQKADTNYLYHKTLKENPELASNPLSRFHQKQQIKRQYAKDLRAAQKAGSTAGKTAGAAKNTRKAAQKAGEATKKTTDFIARHWKAILTVGVFLLLIVMIFTGLSSCAAVIQGGVTSIVGTSYTAEDEAIRQVEADYKELERGLREEIADIETDYPDYDEYQYHLDEIGHNPFALASYLTAKLYDYTREEAQAEIQALFEKQYTLTLREEIQTRYRTETTTDPETGETTTEEIPYDYYILHVTLTNKNIETLAGELLTPEQKEMFDIYMETKGNKPDVFGDDYATGTPGGGEYTDYEIPPEALSDERFAAMIAEAEKYLGYPYVWGGSSPSTSFDCSGFVCWVINHSGVGNVGRTTAQGIFNYTTPIAPSEAKPGDIIFFTGTYDSGSAVSHVGIYVGNGMMIHCGNPISYASVNTPYWQSHFYSYGRLP